MMKCGLSCVEENGVMNTQETQHSDSERSSTERFNAASPISDSLVAISAEELIKLIRPGQGCDVNELIDQVIHDRQAA